MHKPIQIHPETLILFEDSSKFLESFLKKWAMYSTEIGHDAYTTSKRADCILSLEWFSHSILSVLKTSTTLPTFTDLINHTSWADNLVNAAIRHRLRGITLSMYCGNFKTFLHALENAFAESDVPAIAKKQAQTCIRLFGDAYEILVLEHWSSLSQQETINLLTENNRELAFEKCKYQNILTSISDLVFVLGPQGQIIEANQSAQNYLTGKQILGSYLWDHFPVHVTHMPALLKKYEYKKRHSLQQDDSLSHFEMALFPLQEVSLVSSSYLAVFTDVSAHIQQQSVLEGLVSKHTQDLEDEKLRLEGMNITLKNVLRSIEQQKEENISSRIKQLKNQVLPTVHRLKLEKSKEARDAYLDILEMQLKHIYTADATPHEQAIFSNDLSPTELRICQMLKEGVSSKNIAQATNLSLETVHTHRKNIRKKLGLIGKNTSIFNHLNKIKS